ncbi:Kae1-associated serine/threonine protein kinase [Candidatus Woesearchaeota archaeon]|nr:Kae1-associated serine/threonine protein kinase [Candidatus Woesearchaeota archaeon]
MEQIAQGAEAKLFRDEDEIVKDRFEKTYRHAELDARLRKFRTKREAKVLSKLQELNFPAPKLVTLNDERMKLAMEFVDGKLLKNILEKDYKKLSNEIGRKVALLHKNDIIHGDLTTSNMILKGEIYFIDFGLSFFSAKNEDKAVDLHLLRQALESKHHTVWEKCFEEVLSSYKKNYPDSGAVLQRLEIVESRGRYKGKES